jgi:hypothetical protein
MFLMLPAIATILFHCQPFGIILLILNACIVASFAIAASERDDDAIVFFSHCQFLFIKRSGGGVSLATSALLTVRFARLLAALRSLIFPRFLLSALAAAFHLPPPRSLPFISHASSARSIH